LGRKLFTFPAVQIKKKRAHLYNMPRLAPTPVIESTQRKIGVKISVTRLISCISSGFYVCKKQLPYLFVRLSYGKNAVLSLISENRF
jgi:hypothetical protein